MRAALPAVVLMLVVLAGCCHRRCRPLTSPAPEEDPAAVQFLKAHGVALKQARLAYATPEPGSAQDERRYPVADLYAAAPSFWSAMRRHICGGSDPTWFGEEECRLARKDWRWILAIMLHLGPGLGWGNYTDHVALDGHAAIRIRVGGGVHDGLRVYFRTLRKELLGAAQPSSSAGLSPDVIGTYEIDKDLAVAELGDGWGADRTTSNLRASFIAQSQVSIVLSADGTWTASTIDPVSSAMSGKPAKPKRSRGLWSASGRRITFMPLRAARDGVPASPLKYLEFTGVLDGQGLMRVYKDPPEEYPEAYGYPLRRKP